MMKKKFGWKKLTAIGMGALTAFSLAFGLGFSNISLNGTEKSDSANGNINQTVEGGGVNSVASNYAATKELPYDATAKLHTFNDGDTYWYTDYAEGIQFADPASTIKPDTDLVVVDVVASADKGSKNNPWVIDSKDDWENFVAYTVKTTTGTKAYGSGEHFVLNSDLDYAVEGNDGNTTKGDILTVARFSGSFYGTGHVISNARYTKGTLGTGATNYDRHSTGLFGYVAGSQPMKFADVVLKDIVIDTTINSTWTGGLIGHANGNIQVTGVTVRADVSSNSPLYGAAATCICGDNPWRQFGGIIANYHGAQKSLNLYKCAVDMRYTINDNLGDNWIGIGGLIGHVDGTKNTQSAKASCDPNSQVYPIKEFTVYDCYSNVDCNYTRGNTAAGTGVWTGMVAYYRTIANVKMKRCFSVYNFNAPKTFANYAPGVIGVPGENRIKNTTNTYRYEDCFGYGNFSNGSAKYTMPFLHYYDVADTGTATHSQSNCLIYSDNGNASTKVYNWYQKTMPSGVNRNPFAGRVLNDVNTAAQNQYATDKNAGLTDAARLQNFLKNNVESACYNPAVWETGVIEQITSSFKPDIIETPILVNRIRIKYCEYKDGEDVPYANAYEAGETAGDWKVVKMREALYEPTESQIPANRKFLGWTKDKTGNTAPVREVQKTWHGDNVLYAVWGLADGITVEASLAAKDGKVEAAYDDSVKIKLNPTVTVNGGQLPTTVMTDGVSIKYTWKKGTQTVGSTNDGYTPRTVDDSGTYTYEFRMSSVKEPLWFFDGTSDNSVAVTVTPAEVRMKGDPVVTRKSDGSDVFYYGMQLQDLTAEGTVFTDRSRATVAGTVVFEGNYKLDVGDAKDDDSGNRGLEVEIKFTPESNNYETKKVKIFIYPQELPLIFELSYSGGGTVDHTLTTGLEYGNNNTAAKIASDFEAAYAKFLDDNQDDSTVMKSVAGKRPYIVGGVEGASDGEPISLDEYRTSGASIDGPTDAVTIKISLQYEEYDVTLDADNGVDDPVTKKLGYGIRISQSDWPGGIEPAKDGYEFVGWFVADETGALTEEKWDPNTTRVVKNVSIKAKWFKQDLKLNRLEVTGYDKEGVFVADTPLQDGDLTVVAVYTGLNSKGENVEVRKTLSLGSGGYTLRYQTGDVPYVNAPEVTVSYTDGTTVTKTVTLEHVSKKKYETNMKSFRSVSYAVDDPNSKIPEVSDSDILAHGKLMPEVEYTYSIGSATVSRADVDLKQVETYWITAHFKLKAAYENDYYVEDIRIKLEIYAGKTVLTVKWDTDTLSYSGAGQLPKLTLMLDGEVFNPTEEDGITLEYLVTGSNVSTNADTGEKEAVIVGSYHVEALITADKYVLKDGTEADEQLTFGFKIIKAKLQKPVAEGDLDYNGEKQSVTELLGSTYDPLLMKLAQQYEATDAGSYRASVALVDTRNSEWEDGTTSGVPISWKIKKKVLYANWDKTTVLLGRDGVPVVTGLDELIGADRDVNLASGVLIYRGTTTMPAEVGSYQITVQLNDAALSKNYTIDVSSSVWDFVVVPDESAIVIDIQWDTDSFVFDGATHRPVATAYDMDGNEMPLTFKDSDYTGDTNAKWAKEGGYTVSVKVPNGYFIRKGAQCNYNIIANEEGKGGLDDAANPFNPANDGKDDGTGDNPGGNTVSGLPLWQLIVGGLSAVLFVFCTLKSFGEYGKLKVAKKQAKELAAQSYYGFAPLPLLAMGVGEKFLGLEETPWTIIALVAAGLFVISAVMLFVLSKKRKAAELTVKREEARIAEEKEFAREEERREEQARRDEEQARRDNELKMMFAAMQQQGGGYGQAPAYDDAHIQNLIASTVSALLPAVQQQMALPPAQSDTSGYAQPGYVSPEAEMLRAQMAQQQELMARQEERMARQEELISQLLQNQAAPAYEEEEEIEDDISWLGESDEVISLEESYGALSDEGKRAYYEIGSYIMSKPRTSQNDGRYAVLFKYRRRTLFKLAIKDDAPVLYYPAGSGRGEVRIADEASLNVARSIIDQSVAMVDRELN